MNIDVPKLVSSIGLEELENMNSKEAASDFVPACIAGLADGDLYAMHEPYDGNKADLYGESHYSQGRVAKKLLEAALENGLKPGPLYDIQTFMAGAFTEPLSPYSTQIANSSVHVFPEFVTVDSNRISLPRKPEIVLDYGACLNSRSYQADQMDFVQRGYKPFAYMPLTRLHFTNQVLINNYDSTYGKGTAKLLASKQLYIGREDGVAAATNEMLHAQQAHSAPTEVADVIICAGSQHSTAEDLRQGVSNALLILREGGKLIVRSLAQPASDEVGTKDITGWAFEAGFQEKGALRYEAGLMEIGHLLMSGHFGERAIESIILTK